MILDNIVFEVALIFIGASLLSTIFLQFRQPIILAYIALGMIVGPWGFGVIKDPSHIKHMSHLGIILLMFLLGLQLHPQNLVKLLKRTSLITIATCAVFVVPVYFITQIFGFFPKDGLIASLALMFSSTLIGLKLIPPRSDKYRHMGEVVVSILLFQDILAILLILIINGNGSMNLLNEVLLLLGKSIFFAALAFIIVESILLKFFNKFGMVQDYIFLMSIGWCLLGAETALYLGLSYEIGAFIAGISLGASPLALKISGGLKPVREFFLILFFFSIGAQFDLFISTKVWAPALTIALFLVCLKPIAFHLAFRRGKETRHDSWELGFRLGQSSEFSILVSFSALKACVIEPKTAYLIQLATILTFIISTYIVVYKYKTPISQHDVENVNKKHQHKNARKGEKGD